MIQSSSRLLYYRRPVVEAVNDDLDDISTYWPPSRYRYNYACGRKNVRTCYLPLVNLPPPSPRTSIKFVAFIHDNHYTVSFSKIVSLFTSFVKAAMGKKGRRDAKKLKLKPPTPPDSDAGEALVRIEGRPGVNLDLDLGPMRFIARAPFNEFESQKETITLYSKDNIEFYVSRTVLSIASPYFRNLLLSPDEYIKETNDRMPPPPNHNWELTGVGVEIDESTSVLDALLRFVYPVQSPVFREPVAEKSLTELPYRLMGPIYDAAKRFDFKFVCQEILDAAHNLIYVKAFPEPGLAAIRAYGVACRLDLSYDTKLKAARNALCVPYQTSPTAGLEGEGVKRADIERFADFHKRALEAVEDLFRLSENDAHPIGLSDVYASFIACAQCSGAPPNESSNAMRRGAAHWWQIYVTKALERLRRAPLDPVIFSEHFLVSVFREAQSCPSCASLVHWKWCNVMPMLAHAIPAKVYEVSLDVEDDANQNAEAETDDCESTEGSSK
ncbi:hypothetical protein ACEPAI_8601 [Sanghuangporus weigelae]